MSLHKSPNPNLIIDFDRPSSSLDRNRVRCGYLFFAERQDYEGYVVPIELKKGDLHTRELHRQLTEDSVVIGTIVPSDTAIRFRPTAAYGSTDIAEIKEAKMSGY